MYYVIIFPQLSTGKLPECPPGTRSPGTKVLETPESPPKKLEDDGVDLPMWNGEIGAVQELRDPSSKSGIWVPKKAYLRP